MLWNQQVQTDRTFPDDKMHKRNRDTGKGKCILVAVANSGNRNVIKKQAEKIQNYK
jgi:hypothetical protein